MTEDDLRAACEQLPGDVRDRLSRGPLRRRWACGVCEAFGRYKQHLRDTLDQPRDPDDPMWRAFSYHDVPKIGMKRGDQEHYGPLANDIYLRCLATYRAAGWDGVAEEPNA